MELNIYSPTGPIKAIVSPASSSQWLRQVGVENVVSLSFKTWSYFTLDVNDYILVGGSKFKIKKEYRPKQISTQEYDYRVSFYGREHDAEDIKLCRFNQSEDDLEVIFAYEATPLEMLTKVVQNLNRNTDGTVWKVGEALDAARQTFEFNNTFCWDALNDIASQLETEWWLDGDYVNLCHCERGERVSLGHEQGLISLTQQENSNDVRFFTRLIPRGSTKNIDRSQYGFDRLQLPSRATFLDLNTKLGLKEHVEETAFSAIYPHRTGTISAVRSEEKENEETGKFTVYYIKDKDLPFNPDEYRLGAQVIHVTFQSGNLQGKDFECNWHTDTREFEIINTYPDEESQLPGGSLIPAVGNTYILWNLRMPAEYTTTAERDYEAAVTNFLAEYARDTSIYQGNTDYIYVDKNSVPLVLGQRIRLVSTDYFGTTGYRDSRITRVSCKLENLSAATIDCCNATGRSWKSSVDSSISTMKYTLAEQLKQGVIKIIKTGDAEVPSEYNVYSAKRSMFEFISKKKDDIVQGVITFARTIKSVAGIHFGTFVKGSTGGAIYKDEQGNWHFEGDFFHVRKKLTAEEIEVQRTTHIGGKLINTPAGMICTKVEEFGTYWRCYFKTEDADGRKVYNQFRKDDQAYVETFNLTQQADGMLGNHFFWRLVTGTGSNYIDVSKEDYANESDAPKEGDNIVVLGNRTDVTRQGAIIDASTGSGAPYIRIYKRINSYTLPKPTIDLNTEQSEICAKFISAATGKDLDELLERLQVNLDIVREQTDKEYTLWFFDAVPTMANLPAVDWTTDAEKLKHEQDLYYDRTTGLGYRFEKSGEDWAWVEITDQFTVKALEDAAKAQDTADNKRRIFVTQPTSVNAYDVGDLWTNATYSPLYDNDTLVCITAKKKGDSFSISHWVAASNATTAYMKNLGDSILLAVTGRIENAEELANSAYRYAGSAYDEALYALGIARGAQDASDRNSSAISVTQDAVSVISGRFNADGTLKNMSGLVTTADFANLFSQAIDQNGLVKRADILAFVTEDEVGNMISNIRLSADQIDLNGAVTANGYFRINKDGSAEMIKATFSTSSTGTRIVLDSSSNSLIVYDSSNFATLKLGMSGWGDRPGGLVRAESADGAYAHFGVNGVYTERAGLRSFYDPGAISLYNDRQGITAFIEVTNSTLSIRSNRWPSYSNASSGEVYLDNGTLKVK